MKTSVIKVFSIVSIMLLTSCNKETYQFPSNISYSYCIDMIKISDPLLYYYDSLHIYVISSKFIDYVEEETPDSSIVMFPIATNENLIGKENWCYSNYKSKYENRSFGKLRKRNEDFLSFEYFNLTSKMKSGAKIYEFKVIPKYFLVMLVPDYYYVWPPYSDVYSTIPSKDRSLKLLPIYNRSQRKKLLEIEKVPEHLISIGGTILNYEREDNPMDWIIQY